MSVRRPLAALALAALLLAGCGPKHTAERTNVLHLPMTASPTTFDPAMVQDGTTIDLLQQVFEGLVQWTPQNTLAPALATKWEISKDGRTYTFHLRDGVKFQDGSDFTANDVYASMRRALDPALASPVAVIYLGNIVGAREVNAGTSKVLTGVKVVDPHTVAITIVKPGLYWIYTLTYPTAYVVSPKLSTKTSELAASDDLSGAGTGPFRLTRYDRDHDVVLAANAAYWDGKPTLDGQERPVVTDQSTRHSMFLAGTLDLTDESPGDLDADLADAVLKDQVHFWPRAATYYIGLNQRIVPAFKDIRVRQALAYATDKKQIQQVALEGRLDIAQDILPEGIPGFDPAFQGLPYDPAKAKQLLAAASYPGGRGFPKVVISYRESYPVLEKTVDLIRQQWADNLGITVQGQRTEWKVLLDRESKNQLPCYHIRWAADYLDPQDYYSVLLRTGSEENHVVYSNPKYDALCDAADVSLDPAKRNALYRQAARIVADEVPMIPLYYQKDAELINPAVKGIEDGLMGHLPYKHASIAP